MPAKNGQFCWYELATTNAESAKKFYNALFGWNMEDTPMPGDQGGTYTMFNLKGESLGGIYKMEGDQFKGVPSHWGAYVDVGDVDAAAAKAKDMGATLLYEPMSVPGIGRMCQFKSPTGEHLSIYKGEDPNQSAATFDMPMPHGAVAWCEVMTNDTDKTGSFYTNLFNWKTDVKEMAFGPYTLFIKDDTRVAGMMAITKEMGEVPPHWMYYIHVDDVDAATKKAGELGGNVIVPPMDIPVGRFAAFQDPEGAAISIIKFGDMS